MVIKRTFTGLPPWAINQDQREEELKAKYPEIFRVLSEAFYDCRNKDPYNTPQICYDRVIGSRRFSQKVKEDFKVVFVEKFEQGLQKGRRR